MPDVCEVCHDNDVDISNAMLSAGFPLRAGSTLCAIAAATVLLAACDGEGREPMDAEPDTSALPDTMEIADAPVFRYVCPDGEEFSVQYRNGIAHLILSDTSIDLTRQVEAPGTRYTRGEYDLQTDGPEARLSTPDWSSPECTSEYEDAAGWTAARERGVDFRAVGQEPGWLMEVFGDERIVLTMDYGQEEHEFENFEISTDESQMETHYRASNEDANLNVHVVAEPCQDIMSGEPFEATVTIDIDGRELRGCGRALQ